MKRNWQRQSQRLNNRHQRQRRQMPVIAIMGYTNAGKTSLYNALTGQNSFEDRIFATLDPKAGRVYLSPEQSAND